RLKRALRQQNVQVFGAPVTCTGRNPGRMRPHGGTAILVHGPLASIVRDWGHDSSSGVGLHQEGKQYAYEFVDTRGVIRRYTHLAYADDILLMSKSRDGARNLLEWVEAYCAIFG